MASRPNSNIVSNNTSTSISIPFVQKSQVLSILTGKKLIKSD
jgi:hypothetical protein